MALDKKQMRYFFTNSKKQVLERSRNCGSNIDDAFGSSHCQDTYNGGSINKLRRGDESFEDEERLAWQRPTEYLI